MPVSSAQSIIAERMKNFSGSQTSGMRNRARKLKAEGIHVVNFAAGELDQDTSSNIKAAVHQAVDSGRTQYTDTLGIRELRERVAAKISQKTGVAYSVEETGFTAGAKQALFNANFVLFESGDEVVIPSPYWVTLPEQVRLAGAEPVALATAHNGFQINLEELAQAITSRTRGIILNTPHNPTGVVYPARVLEGIAEMILKHEMVCIFDECYDELVYAPATHHNIVKLVPELKDRTVLVGSLSKSYCMAGWRAGFFGAGERRLCRRKPPATGGATGDRGRAPPKDSQPAFCDSGRSFLPFPRCQLTVRQIVQEPTGGERRSACGNASGARAHRDRAWFCLRCGQLHSHLLRHTCRRDYCRTHTTCAFC